MELLAILGVLVVIGVVGWMVFGQVFQVANTGRAVRSREKRFAEQGREAERERSNAKLWESILSSGHLSNSPCSALCDDCKEDEGEAKMSDFRRDVLVQDRLL